MLDEGIYKATIKDHGIAFSSTKGTPEVFIEFDIEGQSVFADIWLTDNVIERAIKSLQLCGYEGSDFTELNADPPILKDNEVSVTVEHEDYTDDEGNTRTTARVAWVNDPDFQARKRADAVDATVTRFNALLATKQGGGSGKKGDVPF